MRREGQTESQERVSKEDVKMIESEEREGKRETRNIERNKDGREISEAKV